MRERLLLVYIWDGWKHKVYDKEGLVPFSSVACCSPEDQS